MTKKTVFLDMDNVIANFDGALAAVIWDPPEMFVPGFFRNLKVMPGAKEGVQALLNNPKLNVYIGTKHTTATDYSPSEKVGWVREHFPKLLKKMCIVTDKLLLRGDYLIDDDLRWKDFDGHFIHFDKTKPEEEWQRIAKYFENNKDLLSPQEKAEVAYQSIQNTLKANDLLCSMGVCSHKEHQE